MSPCPNGTCAHSGGIHDIYEFDDPYPTCCVEGCTCGHPGTAEMQRSEDGTVTVLHADPVIRVSVDLLGETEFYDRDSGLLRLDSAGEYVYESLRRDPADDRVMIFGRVKENA